MLKKLALKAYVKAVQFLSDQRGSLQDLTWVVGAAVVVALIIIAMMVLAPQTARDFWAAATQWIRQNFGF